MNSIELKKEITSLTRKHDFTNWTIDGIHIWPFVLYIIIRELKSTLSTTWNKSIFDKSKKEISKLLSLQKQQFNDKKNTNNINQSTDIVFLTSSARRVKIVDSYYDRITDPFYDALTNLGYNCTTLEWTYDHQYKIPRHNPSCFIQNSLDFYIAKGLIKRKNYDLSSFTGFDDVNLLLSKIRKGADLSAIFNRDWPIISEIKKLFIKKISKGNIKLAFYYPYYSMVSFGFVLACRKLGITTVELQHGYLQENHPAYTAIGPQPKTGYELLPDCFWAWNNTSKNIIVKLDAAMEKKESRVYIGGNLWNNIWHAPNSNYNPFYKYYHKLIKHNLSHYNNYTKILLTLSDKFFIPKWLSELINSSNYNIIWFIRFHHNTDVSDIEKMKNLLGTKNIEYKLSNELPLPILLTMVDIHVTIESSTIVEAEEFGKPSIITEEIAAERFKSYLNKKTTFAAFSKESFLEYVNYLTAQKKVQTHTNDDTLPNTEYVNDFLQQIKNRQNT